jgi:1,2-diacylglycerol 3-alpha-glucosyltransferase
MRIGLFSDTYTPEINGVVSSIVTLKEGLEAAGHEVYVVTTHPSLLSTSYENRILRLPGLQIKQMYGYVLTSPLHIRAYQIIRDMRLDVIHAHTEFGLGIFARIVARLLHCPMVVTYHTTYEDYTHYVNVLKLNAVDRLAKDTVRTLSRLHVNRSYGAIAPSEKTKQMLQGYGITRSIHVIPTGLDLARFNPSQHDSSSIQALRHKHKVYDETLVLFVGRLAKEKSIDVAIEGFALAYVKNPHLRFWIVGAGPIEAALKAQVKALNLKDVVVFIGKVAAHEIAPYYQAADVFVSASLTETQGMTFLEALASGTVVFARPDEVLRELIVDGRNGFYFDEPKDFAAQLLKYVDVNDSQRQAYRKQAIASAQSYDRPAFVKRVLAVYQEALSDIRQSMVLETVRYQDDVVECRFIKNERALDIIVSKEHFVEIGLRKGNSVDKDTLDALLEHEQIAKAYQKAIRRLATKDRTRKEMYDYLIAQTTLDIAQINSLIEQLEKRGYLDDLKYAQDLVYSLRAVLQGRRRIQQNLKRKGIPNAIIEKVLDDESEAEQVDNALALAERMKVQLKDQSVRSTKQKLTQRLIGQGYDFNIIEQAIQRLSFIDVESNELNAMRKLAQKLKRKHEKRLHGTALRNSVFNGLDRQGFNLDDIYVILNEMEWNDEPH